MKIDGWECIISADGRQRAASHPENGSIVWFLGQGIVAACSMPTSVMLWLLRPMICEAWEWGGSAYRHGDPNPYADEPPNKDNDPS